MVTFEKTKVKNDPSCRSNAPTSAPYFASWSGSPAFPSGKVSPLVSSSVDSVPELFSLHLP